MAIAKMDKDDHQDGNNVRPPPKKQNQKRLCALETQTLVETTSQITKELGDTNPGRNDLADNQGRAQKATVGTGKLTTLTTSLVTLTT